MRAAEQHRLGPGAVLSGVMLADVDELLRASRDVNEGLDLEVAELRGRMLRAFHSPAPAAAASSPPAATGIGLGFFGAVAIAACVYAFTGPTVAPLSMCPVLEAAAVPASSPPAPPAPTVTAIASVASGPSSSTSSSPHSGAVYAHGSDNDVAGARGDVRAGAPRHGPARAARGLDGARRRVAPTSRAHVPARLSRR